MNSIKSKRGLAKGALTRAASFAETVNISVPLEMLQIRLTKLEEAWSEFMSLQNQLCDFADNPDFVNPDSEIAEYETKYFIAQSTFTNFIHIKQLAASPNPVANESAVEKLATQQATFLERLNSNNHTSSSSASLPKISIPSFSGTDYKDWPAFRDLFISSVDCNASLTSTQKFYFLKSSLTGDALKLIQTITISDNNYLEAWDKLESRYDRTPLIIQSYVQTYLSLPSINSSNVSVLRKITDGADEVIRGLNALSSNSRDPWLIYLLLKKLDPETNEAWAHHVGSRDDTTINEFIDFLHNRCICLESCFSSSRSSSGQPRNKTQGAIRAHLVESRQVCPKCKADHSLFSCKEFLAFSIESRRIFVKEHSLCFNCLRGGHNVMKCRSIYRCKICKAKHNTVVHLNIAPETKNLNSNLNSAINPNPSSSTMADNTEQPIINNHSCEPNCHVQTILPTAIAKAADKQNSFKFVRLLLDTGSQVSFISESAVQGLGLVRKQSRIPVLGVGSTPAGYTNGVVSLRLISRFDSRYIDVTCHVLSKLTSLLPPTSIENICIRKLNSYELADPNFYHPTPIDIVIGVDKVFNIITGTPHSQEIGRLSLIPTIFGSVVAGNTLKKSNELEPGLRIHCAQVDQQEFDIGQFWRLEEVDVKPTLSADDQRVEDLFISTHTRLSDGRYMVKLPFKTNEGVDYGDSFGIALNRFHAIERRFSSNPSLKQHYRAFIDEYLSLGHMEEIPSTEINLPSDKCYYLPHHAVFKADSSTTKIRVVFDGSAKAHNSVSLNESLLAGPTISQDIFTVTLRFRRHKYAIAGDAEKMYRQIRISPEQVDFQRIVWRESPDYPIRFFRLLTVTYGTKPASYLAVRTLKQLAIDSAKTHPLAAAAVLQDSYIDDIPTGADEIEEVMTLHTQLVDMFRSGGFNLRKWTTNCWALLMTIPDEQREMSPIEFEEFSSVKILGLLWCPLNDCFTYRVRIDPITICSKRTILSDASRIFDPLGFISPITVAVKILLQDLWREKLGWDDKIHKVLADRWTLIHSEMPFIEKLRIQRTLWVSKEFCEFHGFCDASLDAYAAVVYCRSVDTTGAINVSLVAAKSKVAPIKVVSLPKLELCGALLLSRLITKLKTSFQEKEMKVFAWTDSKIVLSWLSAPPKTWSVFVANRTAEIISSISLDAWKHVRSTCNPADCATRGISPSSLISNELWWKGPSWLWEEKINWPCSTPIEELPAVLVEKRKLQKLQVCTSSVEPPNIFEALVNRSSNWIQCLRVVAYMIRFTYNSRSRKLKRPRNNNPLSSSELFEAKIFIINTVQMSLFPSVITRLQRRTELPSKNKLLPLAPFLDSHGTLRVGGRVQSSELSYNAKHPIILCKTHHLSDLLAKYYHRHFLHAGITLMFAMIKQNFYILGCRNLLRKIVHQCIECFRQRKATSSQLMGALPEERVRFQRPFSKVGCDYAGPITLRLSRGRNPKFVKAYIALFVCFITKGIHLELVGDLTSNSFLMALDRFCARRGKPSQIWSDNGTNFHGARRILNEMYERLLSQQHQSIVIDHLSKDNIDWKFLPPSAPHFGGLWEAGVKSVKQHLKRTIGDTILTYEEMYTLLTRIEALLNSRPLWPTSDTELSALTPSHFMIGEPLSVIPHPEIEKSDISIHTNWYLLQAMLQGFWKRWHLEYLTSLQQRRKWNTPQRNLAVDDVVLLKEPNLPPSKWILGRVTQIHPGNDGNVRVVTVVTKFGEYTRPIVKVAPFPAAERPLQRLSGGAECSERRS